MPDPYTLDDKTEGKPRPRVTLLTVVAVVFLGFMVVNVAISINNSQSELEARALGPGDRIEYHYTVTRVDGTLVETSDHEVAVRAAWSQGFPAGEPEDYGPLRATLDPDSPGLGWGQAVEERVLAAHVGQTVRVRTDLVTDWEPVAPEGLLRTVGPFSLQREEFIPNVPPNDLQRFESGMIINPAQENPVHVALGPWGEDYAVFPTAALWDIEVVEVNHDNQSILLRHTVQDGDTFPLDALPIAFTVELDGTQMSFRVEVDEEVRFTVVPGGPLVQGQFSPGMYRVTEVAGDRWFMDYSAELEALEGDFVVQIQILQKV